MQSIGQLFCPAPAFTPVQQTRLNHPRAIVVCPSVWHSSASVQRSRVHEHVGLALMFCQPSAIGQSPDAFERRTPSEIP